jgi:lysozyme
MTDSVIDLSHFNGNPDFTAVKSAGILGVIHKATQGADYQDPLYDSNRSQAQAAGLLWGAYHFGTSDDPGAQVNNFLNWVGDTAGTLLVLDFEASATPAATMSLEQARTFVTMVQQRTGKWPGLYGGSLIRQLLGGGQDPVLANCFLWLADYAPQPVVPANWQTWTLWQYTSTGSVEGVQGSCDRDMFNGSAEQLTDFWTAAAPAAA